MVRQDFLSEQINAFELFLESEEYSKRTISIYTKYLLKFLNWLDEQGMIGYEVTAESIDSYFRSGKPAQSSRPDFNNNRATICQYYHFTTGHQYRHRPSKNNLNKSIADKLNNYNQYLDEIFGFAETTRISHFNTLKRFFIWLFNDHEFAVDSITIPIVQQYLSTEVKYLRPVSKNSFISKLRSFFRYQAFIDKCDPGMLAMPFTAPVYKLAGVPATFEKEELESIRTAYDLNKPTGVRDLAIFFCFTELGLRASEVANLSLDDFNWHEGTVIIRKTKTHQARILPLPQSCGEGIYAYLKMARPESLSRIVFLRFAHQRGAAMGREQIRGTIRRAYARAGINSAITGTHILRHSKAKSMYENGSSLKVIADVLGHDSIDTAVIYTKAATSNLQCVTCPWIEVTHD